MEPRLTCLHPVVPSVNPLCNCHSRPNPWSYSPWNDSDSVADGVCPFLVRWETWSAVTTFRRHVQHLFTRAFHDVCEDKVMQYTHFLTAVPVKEPSSALGLYWYLQSVMFGDPATSPVVRVSEVFETSSLTRQALQWDRVMRVVPKHCIRIVDVDLPRTFPRIIQKGSKIWRQLFRVLSALALFDTQIGYVQGINFIVAFLLLHCSGEDAESKLRRAREAGYPTEGSELESAERGLFHMSHAEYLEEERAFWLALLLFYEHDVRSSFAPGMPGLFKGCFVCEQQLKCMTPHVWRLLRRTGVTLDVLIADWLLTLFTKNIPTEPLSMLFDLIFKDSSGLLPVYRVAILRVLRLEQQLLEATDAGLPTVTLVEHVKTWLDSQGVWMSREPPGCLDLTASGSIFQIVRTGTAGRWGPAHVTKALTSHLSQRHSAKSQNFESWCSKNWAAVCPQPRQRRKSSSPIVQSPTNGGLSPSNQGRIVSRRLSFIKGEAEDDPGESTRKWDAHWRELVYQSRFLRLGLADVEALSRTWEASHALKPIQPETTEHRIRTLDPSLVRAVKVIMSTQKALYKQRRLIKAQMRSG